MVTEAPAARELLREADRLFPGRSRKSDGILPSNAHTLANPTSNHERGNAVDLTHDPGHGLDCLVESERLRLRAIAGLEQRPTELIHDRRIATRARGWTWRSYAGRNPHTSHLHISLDPAHRTDTSPWLSTDPGPNELDIDMTEQELAAVVRREVDQALALAIRGDKTHPYHLRAILQTLVAIARKVGAPLPEGVK